MDARPRNFAAVGLTVLMVAMALLSLWFREVREQGLAEAHEGEVQAAEDAMWRAAESSQSPKVAPSVEVIGEPGPVPEVEPESGAGWKALGFDVGDEYQGIWYHQTTGFDLRLSVTAIDDQEETATLILKCPELGEQAKYLHATMEESGSILLTGVEGAGIEEPGDSRTHGYDLKNLLYANALESIELKRRGDRFRGEAGSGAHVYFWARIPGE